LKGVCAHLQTLKQQFETYFPNNFYDKFLWVRDPFHADTHENNLSLSKTEQLIELSNDSGLKMQFRALSLAKFWISPSVRYEYPELSEDALKIVMQFASIYLCEKGFSSLIEIKTKYRNRLNVCADLRLKLTNTQPDIQQLCEGRQAHPSH
jgi:hypothetical protein